MRSHPMLEATPACLMPLLTNYCYMQKLCPTMSRWSCFGGYESSYVRTAILHDLSFALVLLGLTM